MMKRRATWSTGRQRKKSKENDEDNLSEENNNKSQPGIIQKIAIQNFMCHSNLEFELGPNINFIIGRNGSGKSAILNAILLAFGGRSSTTGRCQILSSFIQTNKQIAHIHLTIKNEGPDAYKQELYGKSIIIERQIFKNGRNTYKIKNYKGDVISLKREELNQLLDSLSIHVNNPVAVLTQDGSKTFLQSKDPKKKYELFFRATELDKLKLNYEEAERKRYEVSILLNNKEQTLPETVKDVAQLKRKYSVFQLVKNQKDKIGRIQNELAWANMRDLRTAYEEAEKSLSNLVKKRDLMKQNIGKIKQKMEKYDNNIKEFNEEKDNLKTLSDKHVAAHDEIVINLKNQLNELRQKQMLLKNSENNCQDIDREIKNLQWTLDNHNRKSQADIEKEKAEHAQEIKKLNNLLEQYQGKIQVLNGDLLNNEDKIRENDQNLTSISQEISSLREKKSHLTNELKTLTASIANREVLYGQKMPTLLKSIRENARKFNKVPIGPLGLHVKVNDKRWMFAIEKCLSYGLLSSFICDNDQDAKILKSLMINVLGSNEFVKPIITTRFLDKVYEDVPRGQFKYSTVLDLIDCENPVVMNCLIDQRAVESILLIEKVRDAMDYMEKERPGVSCGYTIEGDQIYPYPNYRFYSCKDKSENCSLLRAYNKERIEEMQMIINNVTCKIDQEHERKLKQQKFVMNLRQINSDLKGQHDSLKRNSFCTSKKIEELQTMKQNQPQTSSMISEIEDKTNERDHLQEEITKAKSEISILKSALEDLKKKREELKTIHKDIKEKFESKANQIEALEESKRKYARELNSHLSKIKEEDAKIEDKSKDLTTQKEILDKTTADTSALCPEISTRKSVQDLQNLITDLEKVIEEHHSTCNETEEEILNLLSEKSKLIETCQNEIDGLKDHLEHLKVSVNLRIKKFNDIRDMMALRVQYIFCENIRMRDFSGELKFDHERQTLHIEANPRNSSGNKANKSTQSLSGGERSFITVALLMALSHVTEIPFHILDEYDVYMDSMNKELSLQMMLAKADEQRKNQFIFLSPLELPNVVFENKELVKIHRMLDPERSSQTF